MENNVRLGTNSFMNCNTNVSTTIGIDFSLTRVGQKAKNILPSWADPSLFPTPF